MCIDDFPSAQGMFLPDFVMCILLGIALSKFDHTMDAVRTKMKNRRQIYEHEMRTLENHLQDVRRHTKSEIVYHQLFRTLLV